MLRAGVPALVGLHGSYLEDGLIGRTPKSSAPDERPSLGNDSLSRAPRVRLGEESQTA